MPVPPRLGREPMAILPNHVQPCKGSRNGLDSLTEPVAGPVARALQPCKRVAESRPAGPARKRRIRVSECQRVDRRAADLGVSAEAQERPVSGSDASDQRLVPEDMASLLRTRTTASRRRFCRRCGEPLPGRRREFCSDRCRMRSRREAEKTRVERLFADLDQAFQAVRAHVLGDGNHLVESSDDGGLSRAPSASRSLQGDDPSGDGRG